jgi:hypothetical protein
MPNPTAGEADHVMGYRYSREELLRLRLQLAAEMVALCLADVDAPDMQRTLGGVLRELEGVWPSDGATPAAWLCPRPRRRRPRSEVGR